MPQELDPIEWDAGIEVKEFFGAFGRLLFRMAQQEQQQDLHTAWADTEPAPLEERI